MSKRYYYDCPIKAAYMSHKFGVITYVELSIESEIYDKYFIKDWNHRELKLDPKEEHYCDKYYVAKESEHIFEPKKGDEGRWLRPIGAHYANHNGGQWVSAGIEPNPPKIIMRDNKQFFMPEVEND